MPPAGYPTGDPNASAVDWLAWRWADSGWTLEMVRSPLRPALPPKGSLSLPNGTKDILPNLFQALQAPLPSFERRRGTEEVTPGVNLVEPLELGHAARKPGAHDGRSFLLLPHRDMLHSALGSVVGPEFQCDLEECLTGAK